VELEKVDPSQSSHPLGRPEYVGDAPIDPTYITTVPTGVSKTGDAVKPSRSSDAPVAAPDAVIVTPSILNEPDTEKLSCAMLIVTL
jgi:hypothetical protein